MDDAGRRRFLDAYRRVVARPAVGRLAAAIVAVVSVALAVILRFELAGWLHNATYMPFFLAVIFSAWAGGLFGGLICVALSTFVCAYLLLPPAASMTLMISGDRASLALFCFTAVVICLVAEAMHLARGRVEVQAQALRVAQRELRVRDEQIELALEVGRIVTWDHNLDTGEVSHSASARALLGSAEITAGGAIELIHPDDRERTLAVVAHVLAGGEAHRVEIRALLPDGQVKWFSSRATLRVDSQTGQRHLTGLASDISDRKRAEFALGASEDRFRTMVETIPQLMWMARPDGDIYWFNQRWYDYTGSTFDQMKGGGWASAHDPAWLRSAQAAWEQTIAQGTPLETTFPLRSADGSYRLFLTKVVPLKDELGRVLQWFGTHTDVSELHALQEQLRTEDRRKDEFLATLAHELRNPLAPLVTGLDLLESMKDNVAGLHGVRKLMQRQLQRMSRLLDDLLDVSRVARGSLELRKKYVLLSDALTEAIETSQPVIEQGHHTLELVQGDQPIGLIADPHRLTQIFSNLLNNAARYTDSGGRIRVVVECTDTVGKVRVIDDGIGMAPETIPQLFKMFSQLAPAADRSRSGLGIGLSLVRRLVELHGGSVTAFSEGLGKGSEFVVELPLAEAKVSESVGSVRAA
ncbi:PAS domain S-box-containing protein [Panacagrimonas perspica]|uniref:histidine kinase n=1 Tax=Panacagrimonas perspica TaxID=381431 RepID=A0A4R7NYS8_9GAMM|nr:ATP-binding protein [Panacagrimonas perspica]TDU26397.1 PAS domain S-box-containing protein [Panacagrimonas perspica]THD02034.1 hypothetical protein B1810_16180 [Panacagrimonas perspica]